MLERYGIAPPYLNMQIEKAPINRESTIGGKIDYDYDADEDGDDDPDGDDDVDDDTDRYFRHLIYCSSCNSIEEQWELR